MEVSVVGAAEGNGPDLTDGIEFEVEVPHPLSIAKAARSTP